MQDIKTCSTNMRLSRVMLQNSMWLLWGKVLWGTLGQGAARGVGISIFRSAGTTSATSDLTPV